MKTTDIVDIADESIQQSQLERLKIWAKRVSQRKSAIPICEAVERLIELGMLRYGTWLASFGPKTAFISIGKPEAFQRFLDENVTPDRYIASLMIEMFAEGRLLMDPGYRKGNPEFIFYAAAQAPALVQ